MEWPAGQMVKYNVSGRNSRLKRGNLQHPISFPYRPLQFIDLAEEKHGGQKHRCPDFKGIETNSSTDLSNIFGNTDALISKGLRLSLLIDVMIWYRKHRCPDFKGIETI